MNLRRSSGIVLHPTSLPGGRLGADAYAFVDWLQAAGQSWWQMLPLGPPDDVGSPVRVLVRVRGLERPPRRPRRAGHDRRARRVPEGERLLDRGLGAGRRQRRRSGPVRARVDGAARVRARAGHRPDRRRADLRRPGKRRPPGAPGAVPRRPRGRRSSRSARPARAALGQPALRLGRRREGRLSLVDRAAAADARALRPDADRPLPRLRRLLGDPGGRAGRAHRPLAARPAGAALPGRRGGARPAARDRRGPGR